MTQKAGWECRQLLGLSFGTVIGISYFVVIDIFEVSCNGKIDVSPVINCGDLRSHLCRCEEKQDKPTARRN